MSNKDLPKNETITQEEFLESKLLEMMEAKLQLVECNEIKLGVTVQETEQLKGKMKTTAEGDPLTNPQTGEVLYWADSYYATVTFQGGELKVRITEEQFNTLTPSKKYLATGRLNMVTPDKGFAYLKAEFKDFQRIF